MALIGFIFPGQGSQYIGMGRDLYENFRAARDAFEEASDSTEINIKKLCFEGPESNLNLTEYTQPAVLTVSVAALRALQEESGKTPAILAGHSVGEYTALVASEALSLFNAAGIVRKRGQFMQEAVPPGEGAMAAVIGLPKEEVEQICREAAEGEVVSPANYNSPEQIVISGHSSAVNRATVLAKERGARRMVMLPVSAPFHCRLMEPAQRKLAEALVETDIAALKKPVIANINAQINQDCAKVKDLLIKQMCHPILWEDSMKLMIKDGIEQIIEIGPKNILSGLFKRVNKQIKISNVEDTTSLKGAI
ncbi:MAG: ACP S-malonyltransferase [Deltaproteobacteria bacterium]|nr:MAG: ACP S-malonyltransferase [Deltaproteobacteria bacterium]